MEPSRCDWDAIEAAAGCNGVEATEGMPLRYHKPEGGEEAEVVSRSSSGWLEEERKEEAQGETLATVTGHQSSLRSVAEESTSDPQPQCAL